MKGKFCMSTSVRAHTGHRLSRLLRVFENTGWCSSAVGCSLSSPRDTVFSVYGLSHRSCPDLEAFKENREVRLEATCRKLIRVDGERSDV